MLYGHKTVMLFYETFKTSYSYSSIDKVVDTEGLNRIVGKKDVNVSFFLMKPEL